MTLLALNNRRRGILSNLSSFDSDAQALITAASITDITEQNAINDFFVALKDGGLYNLITAGWLCVGDSYSSMKYNLKNPVDTDSGFRLSGFGGITYSSTGVKGNGTNGYINTHVNQLTHLIPSSNHFTYYIRENIANDAFIGVGGGNTTQLYPRGAYYNNQTHYASGVSGGSNANGNIVVSGQTDSRGLYMINRISSTEFKAIKNGIIEDTRTYTFSGFASKEVYLSARNFNGASGYDNREWCYASFGGGMTDAQALAYYNIIQDFQIAKNRNI